MGVVEGEAAPPQTVTAVITSVTGACTRVWREGLRVWLMLNSGNIDITGTNFLVMDGQTDRLTDSLTRERVGNGLFITLSS